MFRETQGNVLTCSIYATSNIPGPIMQRVLNSKLKYQV